MIMIDEKELRAVPERIFTTPLPRPDSITVYRSSAREREEKEARIDRVLDGVLSAFMICAVIVLGIQAACFVGL